MPATPDMDFFEKYKDIAEEAESSESSNKRRNVQIENEEEEEEFSYTQEKYQDEGAELEDEEGRFFGGGLTAEQSNILDLVDEYDVEEVNIFLSRDNTN